MTDKRAEIETVASAAIKKAGLSSVSFRTLADAVGVKSSSVHYHFPTKADLTEAVIRRYTDEFNAVLGRILREQQSLRARLLAFASVFEEVAAEGDMCLCGAIATDAVSLEPGSQRALKTFFRLSEAWLTTVLEEARDELTLELPGPDVACLLLAGLEGAGLVDRAVESTEHLNAVRHLIAAITAEN